LFYSINRDLGKLTVGSFTLHSPQSQQCETTYDAIENSDYEECRFYEPIDPSDEHFEVSTCPAYESTSHVN
jgi:hypothetical protein